MDKYFKENNIVSGILYHLVVFTLSFVYRTPKYAIGCSFDILCSL